MDPRQVKCAFLILNILTPLMLLFISYPNHYNDVNSIIPKTSELFREELVQVSNHLEDEIIRIILHPSSELNLFETATVLQSLGCSSMEVIVLLDLIALEIPSYLLFTIRNMGTVYPDRPFHACLDQSVPIVKPSAAWAQMESYFGYNITGEGITVAVLDTGIQTAHPDLDDLDDNGTTADPKVILEHSFVQGNTDPMDDSLTGHGTHIAGIIGGTGSQSGGALQGIAPNCTLLNGKVLDANGVGWESWVIQGILWALGNGSDVINLSLATNESGDGSDALSLAVDYAVSQGVPVILAAGRTSSQPYGIGMPGVSQQGITVGASDGDTIAAISSWGPTYDFRLKPDLLAPGTGIDSCDEDGSGYASMSGSSQAAAHVAGAVALLLQVHPSWTPGQIKDALMSNAIGLDSEPYKQGAGRLDIPAAINTSLAVAAVADFSLLGPDLHPYQLLTLTNLRPYPVAISYNATQFSLNISSPTVIPASSSVTVNLSIDLTSEPVLRIWEYINLSVEGKSLHVVACGIRPNFSITVPTSVVLYNTQFIISITCAPDSAPIDFLNDSYIQLQSNASGVIHQIAINGTGTHQLPIQNSSLYRGMHAITSKLYVNHTLIQTQTAYVTIQGYTSALTISDQTGFQWEGKSVTLESWVNVSGSLSVYIYHENQWVLITTLDSPGDSFHLPTGYGLGVHTLRVIFSGTPTIEPCEVTFTLTISPNWLPLMLSILVGLIAVIAGILLYERRKTLRARQKNCQAIIRQEEQKRNLQHSARNLGLEIIRQIHNKAQVDEPELIIVTPPMVSFTKEEMLYDPDKYRAQHLYDQAQQANQEGRPLEEPSVNQMPCPRCKNPLHFDSQRRQYKCGVCKRTYVAKKQDG